MATARKTKREQQLQAACKIAEAIDTAFIDPTTLFGRASHDDLERYTPEMLALSSIRAAADLTAWNGETASVRIEPAADVEPGGIAVSILSIVDANKPFLYDSVMGEVTSRYRDIFLAVHPILHAEPGAEVVLADGDTDAGRRISYIQLHLAPLERSQADAQIGRAHV